MYVGHVVCLFFSATSSAGKLIGRVSFTHSVTGATILITITGFSWAITQWAPFSLVRPHPPSLSLVTYANETRYQLAEAILTEPASSHVDDAISIRLADARTPIREVDSEREVFLPGNASDSEDEEDEEEARKKEERRRVLGNPIAQRSGVNISGRKDRVSDEDQGEEEEEDFEIVPGPRQSSVHSVRLTLQDEDDQADRSHDHEGGLSSKAGIILVRFLSLCLCASYQVSFFILIGNTQRIHRDTAVPRHRSIRHRLCHLRPAKERLAWPPRAPNTRCWRCHKRDNDIHSL